MTAIRFALRQIGRKPGFALVEDRDARTRHRRYDGDVLPAPSACCCSRCRSSAPEQLVNLGAPGMNWGHSSMCPVSRGGASTRSVTPMFRDLEAQQTVFTGIAAGTKTFAANLAYDNRTQSSQALLVSGGYFAALRVNPLLGRLIGPQDDARIGEGAVAVVSHQYWQHSLGADPNVVGSSLVVNGQTLTIVGVTPEGFAGTTAGWNPSVFVPLAMRARMEANPAFDDNRNYHWVYAFGRLKPGVSPEQARARLNGLYAGIINEVDAPLNSSLPPDELERLRASQLSVDPGERGQSVVPRIVGAPLAMLLGVTAVVLLIVCVNIANLMLARGAQRAGELAIRASIGASRRQLIGDLLLESGVLAVLGGLASVPIALATLRGVIAMIQSGFAGDDIPGARLSAAAGAFAAALTLVTVLLFGSRPAFRASRADPGAAMKGQAHNAVSGRGVTRFGSVLATSQIVFSMMLLVFAGLFARSLANLARADLGMNVDSVVTFTVSPRRNGYSNAQAMQFYAALERDLASQAGVTGVASSMVPLIASYNWGKNVKDRRTRARSRREPGARKRRQSGVLPHACDSGAAGAGLHASRWTPALRPTAIVNQAFVHKFHLEDGAIGKRLALDDKEPMIEIVGVVGDAKYSEVRVDAPAQLILPRLQNDNIAALSFYVRAALPADVVMSTIKRVVAAADPNLPVTALGTMRDAVQLNLGLDRLVATAGRRIRRARDATRRERLVLRARVQRRAADARARTPARARRDGGRAPQIGAPADREDRADRHADRARRSASCSARARGRCCSG